MEYVAPWSEVPISDASGSVRHCARNAVSETYTGQPTLGPTTWLLSVVAFAQDLNRSSKVSVSTVVSSTGILETAVCETDVD